MLWQRFGRWPSFHDGHLVSLDITGNDRVATICLYVAETPEDGFEPHPVLGAPDPNETHLIVCLRMDGWLSWTGALIENTLHGVGLRRTDNTVQLQLQELATGAILVLEGRELSVIGATPPTHAYRHSDGASCTVFRVSVR